VHTLTSVGIENEQFLSLLHAGCTIEAASCQGSFSYLLVTSLHSGSKVPQPSVASPTMASCVHVGVVDVERERGTKLVMDRLGLPSQPKVELKMNENEHLS